MLAFLYGLSKDGCFFIKECYLLFWYRCYIFFIVNHIDQLCPNIFKKFEKHKKRERQNLFNYFGNVISDSYFKD